MGNQFTNHLKHLKILIIKVMSEPLSVTHLGSS